MPNIIYMGTPEFAIPALEAIYGKYGLSAVVTVPDKPKGRGLQLQPSPVAEKAVALGIPILKPEKLKDSAFVEELKSYKPDMFVVVAFRILPEEVYTLPKLGAFNIHGSLLPKYRGAAPINWAIINGEKETGLTSFLLANKVDTGSILLKKSIPIPENSTAGDLHDLLMPLSSEIALETIELLISGNYQALPQDESLTTPAPKIFPEQCKLDFKDDYVKLKNFIHGVSPSPGAWCLWNDKRLKLLRVELFDKESEKPGEFHIDDSHFVINCGNSSLNLIELQLEGKKAMPVTTFLMGYRGEKNGMLL